MDVKAGNTRKCWSSAKEDLVRSGKDSEEGAIDIGDARPVSH